MNEDSTVEPKTLTVPHITTPADIAKVPAYAVDIANWPDYPGGPDTSFRIATMDDRLLVRFTVQERDPRAVNTEDLQPVWEDSCVEFFCQLPGDERYFNFEFNSRGACVASSRLAVNEGVIFCTPAQLASISREVEIGPDAWSITVGIPLALIGAKLGMPLKANFYKCGDKCDVPHFLSWSAIDAPAPAFHLPAFFGTISLANF